MKYLRNRPALLKPNGKPYEVQLEVDGEPETATLAQWIIFFLDNIPLGHLATSDGARSVTIMQACYRADPKGKGSIPIHDDHLPWLKKIFFDEAEAKRLAPPVISPTGQTAPGLDGPWILNRFGYVAIALEEALEDIVKEGEGAGIRAAGPDALRHKGKDRGEEEDGGDVGEGGEQTPTPIKAHSPLPRSERRRARN